MDNTFYKVHTFNNVSLHDLENIYNIARCETLDFRRGCLIDNVLIATDYFYIAFYETYKNEWSSVYTVKVQHYNDNDYSDVVSEWDKFIEEYDKEYGTEEV